MLHHIQSPLNQQIVDDDYVFCANRSCDIGYFSTSDSIAKAQLRAFHAGQQAMLCYCFDISEAVYRAALGDGTAAAIKAFVVAQTKEGLCACESRNPSGRCCLAAFKRMEKEQGELHDC